MVGAQVSLNPDKYRTITTFSHSSVLFRVKQIKKNPKTQHAFFKKSEATPSQTLVSLLCSC